MKLHLTSLILLCVLAGNLHAADELQPRLTKPVQVLLDETFSTATMGKLWAPGGGGLPESFSIADGALRGVCAPEDHHGPAARVLVDGRNLTIGFRFKFEKQGPFSVLLDGESQFGGKAHLLRVSLSPGQMGIQQDRGTLASKAENKKARDAATASGRPAPVPTKEQLADPKYHRIEKLASQPAKTADDQWHKVLVEQNGNDVLVQVDDGPPLAATGTVFDAKKMSLAFFIMKAGTTVRVDDVKVWENTRLEKAIPASARQ